MPRQHHLPHEACEAQQLPREDCEAQQPAVALQDRQQRCKAKDIEMLMSMSTEKNEESAPFRVWGELWLLGLHLCSKPKHPEIHVAQVQP